MKENSKMINLKERDNLYGNLVMFILEIGKKEKRMELENLRIEKEHIQQGQFINNFMHDKELDFFINPFLGLEDLEFFYSDNKLNKEMKQKQSYQYTPENIKIYYNVEQ